MSRPIKAKIEIWEPGFCKFTVQEGKGGPSEKLREAITAARIAFWEKYRGKILNDKAIVGEPETEA